MEPQWKIVLKKVPEAKGWRVTALVYDPVTDELLATDEGNLMALATRRKVVGNFAEQLKLGPTSAKAFGLAFDRAWLAFYDKYQNSAAAGPAQESAADLLAQMPEGVRREARSCCAPRT
jgi:hypothetical protein